MTHNIEVPINRYEILSVKPNAWQLLLDKSLSINKGDEIVIIEVDSSNNPTGRIRSGIVQFLSCINEVIFSNNVSLYYVIVLTGVGYDSVGVNLVVG